MMRNPERYVTASDQALYQIPIRAFENFEVFAYLILIPESELGPLQVLIDTGSGFGESNQDLISGLDQIAQQIGQPVDPSTLTHILISHGHLDHSGGLPFLRENSSAQIGVHELDLKTIVNFEERLEVVSHELETYFLQAGLAPARRNALMQTYRRSKLNYTSTPVDFTFGETNMKLGPIEILHVPGHCPGHVIFRLADVLILGDHVLSEITPHQAPEKLTLSTGLSHYLSSLHTLRDWSKDATLGLPGHKQVIHNLPHRIDQILAFHTQRLQVILELLRSPHTIAELTHHLFGDVEGYYGYNQLLALEEVGAHVEYLYQRGRLQITNLDTLIRQKYQSPIYYTCFP